MLERPITTASRPASDGMHRLGQHHAAERRARHQRGQAAGEPAGIERMEAVDVLGRIDRSDDFLGVDLLRQRQLHQNAVHVPLGIELRDQASSSASLAVAGSLRSNACMPASATAFDLLRT